MAPGPAAGGGFHRGGVAAGRHAENMEAAGGRAARADGAIIAAGVLRSSALLLRGTDAARQRVDVERMEAGCAADGDIRGHAVDREDFREERSQVRAKAENRKFARATCDDRAGSVCVLGKGIERSGTISLSSNAAPALQSRRR